MILKKKIKLKIQQQTKSSGLSNWISIEIQKINYNISDQSSIFLVNPEIKIKGKYTIIQLYIKPLLGVFQQIQFRPSIFFYPKDPTIRPKVYMDRRIYHPNINTITCQLISQSIVKKWNPALDLKQFLNYIKNIIISPDCFFVPNNIYNRKATWHYHFNIKNYRIFMVQHCPQYLDRIISKQLNSFENMDIQCNNKQKKQLIDTDYWSISNFLNKNNVPSVIQSMQTEANTVNNLSFLINKLNLLNLQYKSKKQEQDIQILNQ